MHYPSLIHDFLTLSAERFADKAFIIQDSKTWSFQEIDHLSTTLGHHLISIGIQPQDKVAILLDNSVEVVISLFAVSKAAATFTIINSTVKANKLSYILQNSDTKVLITHINKGRGICQVYDRLERKPDIIWVSSKDEIPSQLEQLGRSYKWQDFMHKINSQTNYLPRSIDQDLAALIYTSGSTGQPKGVMQPHNRMIGVAKSIIEYLENDSNDVILNALSLAFGYGLYQVLMAAMFGGSVVLEKGFVFLHNTMQKISTYNVTGFPSVPTMLAMMLKLEKLSEYDFSSLRYLTNAGAALPTHHAKTLRKLIPHVDIYPMYGLTECVRVCYLSPRHVDKRPDSVGFEIPNCRCRVMTQDGTEAKPGQIGELVVTGSNVMPGYYKDPELTEKVFRPAPVPGQTHLYTGDLFRRDKDGYLYFVSRKDDMMKTHGERVSPLEVENLLLQISGIAEVAVIGIPDEIFGMAIKAFVVLTPESDLSEQKIRKNCSETMENYMIPKYIEILKDLPRTPNGKVDKKVLKAEGVEP
jgi:amino acid adenylation domain-containing protein